MHFDDFILITRSIGESCVNSHLPNSLPECRRICAGSLTENGVVFKKRRKVTRLVSSMRHPAQLGIMMLVDVSLMTCIIMSFQEF